MAVDSDQILAVAVTILFSFLGVDLAAIIRVL